MAESKGGESKSGWGPGRASPSLGGWKNIEFKDVEIGERIGGGGIGIIYDGWYQNQQVALKTLFDPRVSEELKQQYMDELLVMSKVDHSNIVKFIGACMTPPNLFFVMEKCESSLYNILHVETDRLSERCCIEMAVRSGNRDYRGE
jgi:hypothetical protein